MTLKLLFIILAIVFFMLDGLRVTSPRVSWTPLGFAALTIAVFLL